MTPVWRRAASLDVRDGYWLSDASGARVTSLRDVEIAVEGGYLHVRVGGSPEVQLISAPALQRAVLGP